MYGSHILLFIANIASAEGSDLTNVPNLGSGGRLSVSLYSQDTVITGEEELFGLT